MAKLAHFATPVGRPVASVPKLAMESLSRFTVRGMSFFDGFEPTKSEDFAIDFNLSDPPFSVPENASKAGFVVYSQSAVSAPAFSVGFTQIVDTVVVSNPIDVVNFDFRPMSMHIKPRQTMGIVSDTVDSNLNVPVAVSVSSGLSEISSSSRSQTPKMACSRIIPEQLAQPFLRKRGSICFSAASHCAGPISESGQNGVAPAREAPFVMSAESLAFVKPDPASFAGVER